MKSLPVPVFMYHTVGVAHPGWLWDFLTLDFNKFDTQMATLKRLGCNTVTLDELYDHMSAGTKLPRNPFVLTFDDGYLDNWVAVAPILKKYGFRGTVYVNPEFVDPAEQCRPTLEDVWAKRVSMEDIAWKGFLSWPEMRELEKQGVLDIQSHAMSHTWYFSGPKVVDYQHPFDSYIWMNWNKDINKKNAYMSEDPEANKEYGAPIYEHDKSLSIRRYFPNETIHNEMVKYVEQKGGRRYFESPQWREELDKVFVNISNDLPQGRYETEEEYEARLNYELYNSKNILEKQLNKKVDYLCWPGGGYNEKSVEKALQIYKSVTLGSADQTLKKNIFGDDPKTIKRMGIPYVLKNGTVLNFDNMMYLGGYSLYCYIKMFQGNKSFDFFRKVLKAANLVQAKLS